MLPAATPSPCQTLHFVANAKTGGVSANHTQPRRFSASGLHLSPGADGGPLGTAASLMRRLCSSLTVPSLMGRSCFSKLK